MHNASSIWQCTRHKCDNVCSIHKPQNACEWCTSRWTLIWWYIYTILYHNIKWNCKNNAITLCREVCALVCDPSWFLQLRKYCLTGALASNTIHIFGMVTSGLKNTLVKYIMLWRIDITDQSQFELQVWAISSKTVTNELFEINISVYLSFTGYTWLYGVWR